MLEDQQRRDAEGGLSGVLAIIPARGGSKGVPRKNLRALCGRPLVVHSIEHALKARGVNRTVVSTDDEEIARVSREAGAEVIERPANLAGDKATSESALLHALGVVEARDGYVPTTVVFLQATSPVRDADDVDAALGTLISQRADSLVSVCRSHDFLWTRRGKTGVPTNYKPSKRPRRQDMAPQFRENGSIYIMKAAGLRKHRCRLFGRIALYEMDQARSFQVDTEEDFALIEAMMQRDSRAAAASLLANTALVVWDFDGVMSNNQVLVMQDGTEGVLCNRSDGLGIGMLAKAGVPMLVLSKEQNPVVAARCRKLGLECIQGVDDKLGALQRLLAERGLSPKNIAYVGNDINDIPCMAAVGAPIAVLDAYPEVKSVARAVTSRPGGYGAVREVCEWLLSSRT